MIRLSIPVRQALSRLTLPALIAAAFGLMLLGKADAPLAERARMALADALAPVFSLVAEPLTVLRDLGAEPPALRPCEIRADEEARGARAGRVRGEAAQEALGANGEQAVEELLGPRDPLGHALREGRLVPALAEAVAQDGVA